MNEFKLTEPYIELIRLLKYLRLAESGGHAKMMVDEGTVKVNGVLEYRRRAKIRVGDVIETGTEKVRVI